MVVEKVVEGIVKTREQRRKELEALVYAPNIAEKVAKSVPEVVAEFVAKLEGMPLADILALGAGLGLFEKRPVNVFTSKKGVVMYGLTDNFGSTMPLLEFGPKKEWVLLQKVQLTIAPNVK